MLMKERVYRIVCWNTANRFIHGKISGILQALSITNPDKKNRIPYAIEHRETVVIFRVKTTKVRFALMRKHIEAAYPGMCKFC